MTSVFAPLVEDVEDVEELDVLEVLPGIPMHWPATLITVQEDELEPDVGMVVGMLVGMLVGMSVGTVVGRMSVTASSGLALLDDELEESDEELDDEPPPPGSAVRTCAVATPCQIMPTSIIPAATAAMRLTVVRRPGLIASFFPSN